MSAPRARLSPGLAMAIGIAATVALGAVGAFAWLVWVWSRSPDEVRDAVSPMRRGAVIAVGAGGVAANAIGIAMTALALVRTFQEVERFPADEKARRLAEGISSAMNATSIGLVASLLAGAVALVAGFRLLRASADAPR